MEQIIKPEHGLTQTKVGGGYIGYGGYEKNDY